MSKKTVFADGTKEWRNKKGELHRKNGPAVIWTDGTQEWYINGKRHREDGPAAIYPDGYQTWWMYDKLHREDGPAVIQPNGHQEWWIAGFKVEKPALVKPDSLIEVHLYSNVWGWTSKDPNGNLIRIEYSSYTHRATVMMDAEMSMPPEVWEYVAARIKEIESGNQKEE